MPEIPDLENRFDCLKPVHTFERGDRVRLSNEYIQNNSSRNPDILGTVATGAFEFLVYVDWDDGSFSAMFHSSIIKIS